MSKQSVARALAAMDDEGERQRLAAASPLVQAEYDLSNDEIELVRAAAVDYPEVEGFSFQTFLDAASLPLGLPGSDPVGGPARKIPGVVKYPNISLRRAHTDEPEVVGFGSVRHDPYKNFNFHVAMGGNEIPVADTYVQAALYARGGWDLKANKGI